MIVKEHTDNQGYGNPGMEKKNMKHTKKRYE
jgi:hypothetical protein